MTTLGIKSEDFRNYRCNCGKLLFRGHLIKGIIEVKCKRCSVPKVFDFMPEPSTTELEMRDEHKWKDLQHQALQS